MKKTLYLIILLITITAAVAYSDPVNTSLTELKNLTRADNPAEIFQEINVVTNGLIGIVILIAISFVSFALAQFYTREINKSMPVTFFATTSFAIVLRIADLVKDNAFYYCIVLLLLSVGIGVVKKK